MIAAAILSVALAAAACSGRASLPAPDATLAPASVTLHVFHWLGSDIGPVMAEIDRRFMQENPGITIESESFQLDTYEQALERRLAVGDPLDVIGVGGVRVLEQRIKPSDMVDLSAEPWVKRLIPDALEAATDGGRVYALPLGKAGIGVVYNKDMFARLGLAVPTTWPEFLVACQTITAAGIVPIALADSDSWVDQLIPRAMAATAVYEQEPDLDAKLAAGAATFSTSPWRQVLADQLALKAAGCFNEDSLRTTYDQSIEMVATGRAAMVVNGTWIAPQIKAGNEALNLSMFPLPYATSGQPVQVATLITPMFGIPASTAHPAEAKQYLAFLARPEIVRLILEARSELPVMSDVTATPDPATGELLSQAETRSRDAFGRRWPLAAREQFFYGIRSVFTGDTIPDTFLDEMDKAFQQP